MQTCGLPPAVWGCGGRCVALSSAGVDVRCCTFEDAGDSGYAGEVRDVVDARCRMLYGGILYPLRNILYNVT